MPRQGDPLPDAPAKHLLPHGGRVVAVAVGSPTSGIPPDWRATGDMPGLDVVDHLDAAAADAIAMRLGSVKKPGDVAIVSIHWGLNWGFDVPREQARFARRLIDGGVDLVHGHSSHHVRPIEVYRDRLILFGCGDFLDDYEGIGGHGRYRGDLGLMYFPVLESGTGRLVALSMVPMQSRRFSLRQATLDDTLWLGDTLTRISVEAAVSVEVSAEGMLALRW